MSTRVTQNVLDILKALGDYRILSLSQVTHLHFTGKRAARRRMQQLQEEGLAEVLPGAPTERGTFH